MESLRQQKVNRLLQKELSVILQRDGARYVPGSMITVTVVRVSPDLSVARIYLSFFPVKDKKAALENVQKKAGEIRHALSAAIRNQARIIPELVFIIDDSIDRAARIDELLKK